MSEGEGRFRERRSAHSTGEERSKPVVKAESRAAADLSETAAGIVTATGAERPRSPATTATPPPSGAVGDRKLAEAPFFDLVQYVVLRVSQCLGEIPMDESGQQRILPREAKEYIDLLSTLRDRLGAELSPEAIRALDGVLTDLRTRYLEIT